MATDELWVVIPEFPKYGISNIGRIIRFAVWNYKIRFYKRKNLWVFAKYRAQRHRFLHPSLDTNGYPFVSFWNNGVRKTYSVHRLVARCFLGMPQSNMEVNHIDCNKTNNAIVNLEYLTHRQNMEHMNKYRMRIGKKLLPRKLLTLEEKSLRSPGRISIAQYSLDGQWIQSYPSLNAAGRHTNIAAPNISSFLRHKYNCSHVGGFLWKKV